MTELITLKRTPRDIDKIVDGICESKARRIYTARELDEIVADIMGYRLEEEDEGDE